MSKTTAWTHRQVDIAEEASRKRRNALATERRRLAAAGKENQPSNVQESESSADKAVQEEEPDEDDPEPDGVNRESRVAMREIASNPALGQSHLTGRLVAFVSLPMLMLQLLQLLQSLSCVHYCYSWYPCSRTRSAPSF